MARTTDHGYDAEHKKLRASIQKQMDAGVVFHCWRDGKPIGPNEPWDLGHDDDDRTKYNGPEHRACNRATKGHRTTIIVDDSRMW